MRWALAAVALVGFAAAALGIAIPATDGQRAAVDETQYLLTARSIAEDGDLDLADELAFRRWQEFADEAPPQQTAVRPDGRAISPHDPLLPLLLAGPWALGGWVGAKVALAGLAGVLAAVMLWTAVRRLEVPLGVALPGVAVAAASAPLAVYGQQLYPELPAALLVVLGVAALARPSRWAGAGLVVVLATLPWLSVKYVPVAAALALVGAWRLPRREVALGAGVLAVAGAVYLAVHRVVWGGWTVYASGDHFVERGGEFAVMGEDVSLGGRASRLTGLLLDRDYGLVAWQPAWLLVVPAAGALAAVLVAAAGGRLPPDDGRAARAVALLAPLAAGWLVATFVASTMHGFWWPGRHVVVVLPVAVLAVLWWLAGTGRTTRTVALAAGLAGVATYGALLVLGRTAGLTWVLGTEVVGVAAAPWRVLLPDYRGTFLVAHFCWLTVLFGLMGGAFRITWTTLVRGGDGARSQC